MFHYAVESVGKDVLLVKDNKVIGKGRGAASRDYTVSINMVDDRAKALVDASEQVKAWSEGFFDKRYRYSFFHFSQFSGEYVGDNDEFYEPLRDVRVVEERAFAYGMVPDTFKAVEGYGSALRAPSTKVCG